MRRPEAVAATLPSPRKVLRNRTWLSATARDRLLTVASPVALLVLWEVLVRAGVVDARFFPPPSKILQQLAILAQSGELWMHTWASLRRLFFGVLIGGIPALVLGIVMGLYRPV